MRVLLLGAGGLLAHDLIASAPSGAELQALSHAQLDVTSEDAVQAALDEIEPDAVINASGYTAVDAAESDRERAFAVNAAAVGMLGAACARRGVRVVHFSTDYVFDGTATRPYREEDVASPINCYGASKLAGEKALFSSGTESLVIRAQWLFGSHGRSFARSMWDRARARQPTRVVDDQRGRPTFSADLALATWQFTMRGTQGLVHVASSGEATWFDIARRVFARENVPELVSRCGTAESPRPARRPRYSVLDTSLAEQTLGAPLRPWQEALDIFLDTLQPART